MIHFILVILAFILFFAVTLPLYLILLLVGLVSPKLRTHIAQPVVAAGFRMVLAAAGVRVSVLGRENVPDEPVLYATNHRSISDVPIFYTTVPQITGIIAKKEIAKIPFLSWWMRLLNCLFLDRSDLKKAMKTILTGVSLIKKGSSMCIMPEGTRNHEAEMLPFKEGSFKMAEKTGCPVVPVAIWKSDEIFELHMPVVKPTHVTIRYGEPIRVSGLAKEEQKHIGVLVRTRIDEMLQEMK